MTFVRYVRHLFYRTPSGNCFCFTEKYFTNKIIKNIWEKEKKWKHLLRETTTHTEQKLITIYIKSSFSFTIEKLLYFYFLCFYFYFLFPHDILKEPVFRNNAIHMRIYLLSKIISRLWFEKNSFLSVTNYGIHKIRL